MSYTAHRVKAAMRAAGEKNVDKEPLCPACGSKLDAHQHAQMSRCTQCRRLNPDGFLYCGYCATPIESVELRVRMRAAAAPPGGWPNLTGELLQVKFYLQQGRLGEAYELLSILQGRYPGHPELADFERSAPLAVDDGVASLVDEVLANSAKLTDKIARRQAPTWEAPRAVVTKTRTTAHEVVATAGVYDSELDDEGEEITIPIDAAAKRVVAAMEAEARAREQANATKASKGKTRLYPSVSLAAQTGHTVAVPTLQPAVPFRTGLDSDRPAQVAGEIDASHDASTLPTRRLAKAKRSKGDADVDPGRKRSLKRATKSSRKNKVVTGSHQAARRPFGDSFGANVLSRFGR